MHREGMMGSSNRIHHSFTRQAERKASKSYTMSSWWSCLLGKCVDPFISNHVTKHYNIYPVMQHEGKFVSKPSFQVQAPHPPSPASHPQLSMHTGARALLHTDAGRKGEEGSNNHRMREKRDNGDDMERQKLPPCSGGHYLNCSCATHAT